MAALEEHEADASAQGPIRRFLGVLGPGFITGASDDDPSGIGTYSQAGAQLGFGIGWTMLLTFPLMAALHTLGWPASKKRQWTKPWWRKPHFGECVAVEKERTVAFAANPSGTEPREQARSATVCHFKTRLERLARDKVEHPCYQRYPAAGSEIADTSSRRSTERS
jgi:hypothetical protein